MKKEERIELWGLIKQAATPSEIDAAKRRLAAGENSCPSTGSVQVSHRSIELRCQKCGLFTLTPRQPEDPDQAASMTNWCGDCGNGGFDDVHYFDVAGREIEAHGHPAQN